MKIFKFFFLILLILVALESGLQLKAYVKRQNVDPVSSTDGHNVLVIGDSLLGNGNDPYSIFSHLKKLTNDNSRMKINLIDSSVNANYSARANYMADELLKKYNPELSIVLLGGSDYINAKLETSSPWVNKLLSIKNIIYKTYLYKLTITLRLQLKRSYAPKITQKERYGSDPLVAQWAISTEAQQLQKEMYNDYLKNNLSCIKIAILARLTAQHDKEKTQDVLNSAETCAKNMPAGEGQSDVLFEIGRAYRVNKNAEKARAALNKSVAKSRHPDEVYSVLFWISFDDSDCPGMFKNFEKILETKEPNRRMMWFLRKCFADNNQNEEGAEYLARLAPKLDETKNLSLLISQSLMPEKDELVKNILPGENYYYGAKIQQYKMKGDKAAANKLFKNRNLYIETDVYSIDLKNYRKLITKLAQNKRKVIVLQYPSQPDWPVLEAIAPIDGNITFVNLSSIMEKHLDNYSIYELLSEDLVHLNDAGATLVANDLAKVIYKQLEQD